MARNQTDALHLTGRALAEQPRPKVSGRFIDDGSALHGASIAVEQRERTRAARNIIRATVRHGGTETDIADYLAMFGLAYCDADPGPLPTAQDKSGTAA